MTHLQRFDARWNLPDVSEGHRPVFLLAAGWRSGSTLLQRLVCSSGEVVLWGEPYGRSGLIPALARAALALREDWPGAGHFAGDQVYSELSEHWIANLYPPAEALKRSFAAQLDALLGAPARQQGFARFGLKEVRLHAVDARFLQWVYPRARFLFLVRNPWDAWASAKGATWYLRWPDKKVDDAVSFARHWRWLTEGFGGWQGTGAMLLRYEDLTSSQASLGPIRDHLGLQGLDKEVMAKRMRGMSKPPIPLDGGEIATIAQVAGEVASLLGYHGPSPRRAMAS